MSLREAVTAKCKECIYDPGGPGTWLDQVMGCTSPKCPLYPYRPMRKTHVKGAQPEHLKRKNK